MGFGFLLHQAINDYSSPFGESFHEPMRSQSVSPFGGEGDSNGRNEHSFGPSPGFHNMDPFMGPSRGPPPPNGSSYGNSFLSGNLGNFSNPSPFGYSSYFDGPSLSFMGSGSNPEEPHRNSFYSEFGGPPSSSSNDG